MEEKDQLIIIDPLLTMPLLRALSEGREDLEVPVRLRVDDSVRECAEILERIGFLGDSIEGLEFNSSRIVRHKDGSIAPQSLFTKIEGEDSTNIYIGYTPTNGDWYVSIRKPGEKFINFGGDHRMTEVLIGGERYVKWKYDAKGEERVDEEYDDKVIEALSLVNKKSIMNTIYTKLGWILKKTNMEQRLNTKLIDPLCLLLQQIGISENDIALAEDIASYDWGDPAKFGLNVLLDSINSIGLDISISATDPKRDICEVTFYKTTSYHHESLLGFRADIKDNKVVISVINNISGKAWTWIKEGSSEFDDAYSRTVAEMKKMIRSA